MWNTTIGEHGGFMNHEPNENASPTKTTNQTIQSILPVCIRQIRDHTDDDFTLFGIQAHMVKIVGVLRNFEVKSTKAMYTIEDHTGSINAIWWLESDSSPAPNLPLVKEGCYVKVYATLRTQDNEKILMVLRILPVDNINEITTHLLEVIHSRLEAENLQKNNGNISKIKRNNPGYELANSMSFMDSQDGGGMEYSGLNPLQLKVYNVLKSCTTASGLSTNTVCQQFAENQRKDVRAALDYLIGEGHAYSTIDNDHFKVTESM